MNNIIFESLSINASDFFPYEKSMVTIPPGIIKYINSYQKLSKKKKHKRRKYTSGNSKYKALMYHSKPSDSKKRRPHNTDGMRIIW